MIDSLDEDGNVGCVGKILLLPLDVGVFKRRKVILKGGHNVTQQSRCLSHEIYLMLD